MATQTKKLAARAVVGSTKRVKKSKGITLRLALFTVVGILVFSILAGLGWEQWQVRQFKAKAATLPCLHFAVYQGNTTGNGSGVCIKACKTFVNAYGGVWKVSWYVNRGKHRDLSPTLSDTFGNGARQYYTYYSNWRSNSYQKFDSTQSAAAGFSTGISIFKGYGDPHGQLGIAFMSTQANTNPAGGIVGPNDLSNC
jgi:hypothetical protein